MDKKYSHVIASQRSKILPEGGLYAPAPLPFPPSLRRPRGSASPFAFRRCITWRFHDKSDEVLLDSLVFQKPGSPTSA
jgi:hypothetical protein